MAWFGLIGTLVWNFTNYKAGRKTMCTVTRRVVPKRAVRRLLHVGADVLASHLENGYPEEH